MSEPRLFRPEKGNPYYIYEKDGGVNPARGNPMRRDQYLTSLPNCVAIYGWFNEIGQRGEIYFKKAWYPYAVINAAKREGLEVTQEPTKGGVMVWTGGKTNEGHVCGVGEVYDEDHILTVESEYYGHAWKLYNRQKDDGNWRRGCPWMDKSYIYQGCIRNPFVEEEMTYEKFCEMMTKWLAEQGEPVFKALMSDYLSDRANQPPDTWAVPAITYCIEHELLGGDPDGKFRAKDWLQREEFAAYLATHDKK